MYYFCWFNISVNGHSSNKVYRITYNKNKTSEFEKKHLKILIIKEKQIYYSYLLQESLGKISKLM